MSYDEAHPSVIEGEKIDSNNISPSIGYIGFFDILGYKNVAKTNDFPEIVIRLVNSMATIDSLMRKHLKEILELDEEDEGDDIYKIEHISISDSIIALLPDGANGEDGKMSNFLSFTLSSRLLMRMMHESGFPLRGCITRGRYYRCKGCFAGSAIIKAYERAESLDIAACLVDQDAYGHVVGTIEKRLEAIKQHSKMTDFFPQDPEETIFFNSRSCPAWNVPLKGRCEPNRLLNPFFMDSPTNRPIGDIEKYVMSSFSDHGKDIGEESVRRKIRNTIHFMKFASGINQ